MLSAAGQPARYVTVAMWVEFAANAKAGRRSAERNAARINEVAPLAARAASATV